MRSAGERLLLLRELRVLRGCLVFEASVVGT
jgi:hypothetical protein